MYIVYVYEYSILLSIYINSVKYTVLIMNTSTIYSVY